MAYLRFSDLQPYARTTRDSLQKSASRVLKEERSLAADDAHFHIFLSHSFKDAELILQLKRLIEANGLTVYVDWETDDALDRNAVTRRTASVLRNRMKHSDSLVFADSAHAEQSKWMPWELGYFDGLKPNHIFVLPLVENSDTEYKGREYVDLYPKIDAVRDLPGRARLVFEDVRSGTSRRMVLLKEASVGVGLYLP